MRSSYLLLILLVIVSGCISPFGTAGGSGGVSINSMSFSPSNIKSNQLTKLSLSVQNTGDYNIEEDEGYVYIFGLPGEWQISDKSDITSYTQQFSLSGVQNRGGKIFPGEKKDFQWVLRAPQNLPKDEIFSYNAQARVCYPYKTKVWGTLEVISEDAWLQNPPKERQIVTQQTKGPIQMAFISSQPLISSDSVKIKVRITNTGGGVVTTNPCSVFQTGASDDGEISERIEGLNKITLENSDCTLDDPDLYLQKGQSKETSITCAAPSLDNAPTSTGNFIMELSYSYYADKSASISVTGTSEAAPGGVTDGGVTPTITLTDLCTKLCNANGQKVNDNAYGICTQESLNSKYPGMNIDILVEKLGADEYSSKQNPSLYGDINSVTQPVFTSALGGQDAYNKATIKTLNLHDTKAGELGLEKITLDNLQKKTFSAQYEKNSKISSNVSIVDYLCSTISNGTKISSTYTKGGDCAQRLPKIPLSELENLNGEKGDKFKDKPLAGLKITSIAGRTISEITDNKLAEINAEDFKISSLALSDFGFLKYTKCSDKNVVSPYSRDVTCQCVRDVQEGYPKFSGTVVAECTSACTKKIDGKQWAKGGVCDSRSIADATQCQGTTLRIYKGSTMATDKKDACGEGKACICYDTQSIERTEAALLCKQS